MTTDPTSSQPASTTRDGLLLAVGTLTAVRVPAPRTVDPAAARTAMLLAWLPGLLLGAGWTALAWAAPRLHLTGVVTGVLGVAWLLLMTRAFHADGLADTVDGLTASYDPARSLAVMRTGDVGPAGAAALVVVLGLDAASLAALSERGDLLLGGLAIASSRAALALACRRGTRAARDGGLGALVAGTVPASLAVLPLAAMAALAALVAPWAVLVPLAGAAAGEAVAARARARVGGLTGDVLGAYVEIACATSLLAAVVVAG